MAKLSIEKLVDKLPYEAKLQIEGIDTPIKELTREELIEEVEYCIEKMEMDIADGIEDDWELPKQIKQCKSFIKKYGSKG